MIVINVLCQTFLADRADLALSGDQFVPIGLGHAVRALEMTRPAFDRSACFATRREATGG
ncbi:hypothetical protein [Streptomyces sp. NBC_00105]|uniref:hypothetical protein n=1 Tax=unclassified Streptomyces TaxID=2593676 RepID=UPI002886CBCB|nr:hypothetical protein [Streptomyces sp. DSM 41633]